MEYLGYPETSSQLYPDLGVSHGDDLLALFKQKNFEKTHQDLAVATKMVRLWVNFATTGSPDPNWTSISGLKEAEYALIDDQPLRVEMDKGFKKDMDFVKSMHNLIDGYRNFNVESHPAMQDMLKAKEEERLNEYEEDVHDEL